MPVGRMMLWSWILYVVFLLAAIGAGGALGSVDSSLTVPVVLVFVALCVASFVYAMYLSLRVVRNGDPGLLRRGIHGTALVLAAKQTNTVVSEGEFAWQAPFIWKYHLRVSLPDREPYETDCSICASDLAVGSTVNVAAAPHNRKRVTIDVGQAQVKERRRAVRSKAESTEDALRTLAERHEQGQLTDEEFETQKDQLLRS
jgi:Short C-terminal domain